MEAALSIGGEVASEAREVVLVVLVVLVVEPVTSWFVGAAGVGLRVPRRRRSAKLAAPKPRPSSMRRRPRLASLGRTGCSLVSSSLTRGDVTGQKQAGGGAAAFAWFKESTVGT